MFENTTLFSILGIALGVAFLMVSMAGFSGFTRSLKSSIIDVAGDVNVFRRGARIVDPEKVAKEIKQVTPDLRELLGFVQVEVLVANKGNISAVILQGLDWQQAQKLPELKVRQVAEPAQDGLGEPVFVGKAIAQKLKLTTGDEFKVILPKVSRTSSTQVTPKVKSYYVHAILDFGKYEFNQRWMIGDILAVQSLAGMGQKINGFRLRLHDSEQASKASSRIQEILGWDFAVRDWTMTNRSLFQAIQYEKTVLFFVMLIMVIAAFFNVSSTLFLTVVRRYSQISVMRALGLKKKDVVLLFCFHGMSLGVMGLTIGLSLGFLFCKGFENLQKVYPIMPEEVYKMSNFSADLHFMDVVWIIVATLVICFFSTLAPALRGARLSPVEGLKYE